MSPSSASPLSPLQAADKCACSRARGQIPALRPMVDARKGVYALSPPIECVSDVFFHDAGNRNPGGGVGIRELCRTARSNARRFAAKTLHIRTRGKKK